MFNPLSLEALLEMRGHPVYDRTDAEVGLIQDVYYDRDTRVPEWIALSGDFYGNNRVLVPVLEAEERDGVLRVPYDLKTIRDTPSILDREIDESLERELYEHYGIAYSHRASSSTLPEDVDVSVTESSGEPASPRFATRWVWDEGARSDTAARDPGASAATAGPELAREPAAPYASAEPEAAPSAENVAAPPPRPDAGPGPVAAKQQPLDESAVVMTDKPADVPGTLYDTTPRSSRRLSGRGKAAPALLAAATAATALFFARRLRSRRSRRD